MIEAVAWKQVDLQARRASGIQAIFEGSDLMENLDSNGKFRDWFRKAAAKTAGWVGAPWAFVLAVLSVMIWGLLGPYYRYSDTWQLIINTATTVITFLIVFLIQNTQNRD